MANSKFLIRNYCGAVVTKHEDSLIINQVFIAVTITTLLVPAGTAEISLNSFRDSASKGETLHVVHDGAIWKVWASSTTAAERFGSRGEFEVDTTSIFVDALARSFSPGIKDAVVRELGLEPRPGQPLEARVVLQAIAMAEASRQALEGVDFMTRLMVSAVSRSAGFVNACRALGLSADAFSTPQREALDACMQERFAQAAQLGHIPVAPGLAQQWLHAELMALPADTPAPR